jgi:hypothetical protein
MLDGLAHVRPKSRTRHASGLVLLIAGVALASTMLAHRASGTAEPVREPPAAIPAARHIQIVIQTLADARASVTHAPFAADLGVTPEEVAATREIYRFADDDPNFAAGLSAYLTPLAHDGFCIAFAAGVSCSRKPPNAAEPLLGMALDPDAERMGEPFVVISVTAPGVRAVTYTCDGATYPAKLVDGVAAFVSPSASFRADDCVGNATLASGAVISKRV